MRPLPPVVYMRWHFASLLLACIGRAKGSRIVQEVNGNFTDIAQTWGMSDRVGGLIRWSMTWQLRNADLIVCVTEQLADWTRSIAPGVPCAVVTNAADLELFHPGRRYDPVPPLPARFVVFFGAFSPWQGINTMLKATQHAAWPKGVALVMVGGGIEEAAVRQAHQNTGPVVYIGRLPYTEIGAVVARSLASLIIKEGTSATTGVMPLKLFESLGAGVPVVVTDFPGIRDVAHASGAGLVIPPGAPERLAAAVAQLAGDTRKQERMGSQARDWVEAGHSWDARAAQTSELLKRFGNPTPR